MTTKCPSCSAPLKHYVNSNGTSTDYCEYCNYRQDYAATQYAPQSSDFNRTKSPIEIADKEREIAALKANMTDKERRKYEKMEAKKKRTKIFDPVTGMYRYPD